MEYSIHRKGEPSRVLASKECESDYLAEKWAREWAAADGTSQDYTITSADGGFAASLFRTAAGQWYIMLQEATY